MCEPQESQPHSLSSTLIHTHQAFKNQRSRAKATANTAAAAANNTTMANLDFCDYDLISSIWSNINADRLDEVKDIYRKTTPVSLIVCLVNIVITYFSLRCTDESLNMQIQNLLMTNCAACLVSGAGILSSKFLPVYSDFVTSDCLMLLLEIAAISSFIASGLHHVHLSFLLFRRMRAVAAEETFALDEPELVESGCSLVTLSAWILPAIAFTAYFWSIPCQGFRSPDCDFTFFLTFHHRALMLAPLLAILIIVLFNYVLFCFKSRSARASLHTALTVSSSSCERISRAYDERFYSRTSFCTPTAFEFEERRASLDHHGTTVIFLFATFALAWTPRLAWLTLSCVDGCPFPLFQQSLFTRSLIGLVTEHLIILKATIDPLIFVLRK